MGQTPVYVKLPIVALLSKVNNYCVIVCHLQEESIKIRGHTVARILKQYRDSGSLADKIAPGHNTSPSFHGAVEFYRCKNGGKL